MFNTGFLREHSAPLIGLMALADFSALVVTGILCFMPVFPGEPLFFRYQVVIFITTLLAAFIFPAFSLYSAWRGASITEEIRTVIYATTSLFFVLVLLMFMTKTSFDFSRIWTGTWYLSSTLSICCFRIALRSALSHLRLKGYNLRHIVILSEDGVGIHVAKQLGNLGNAGLNIKAYFTDSAEELSRLESVVEAKGTLAEGLEYVNSYKIDQVWLAMPLSAEQKIQSTLKSLNHVTADIRLVPDLFGFHLINHSISQIGPLAMINLSMTPMDGMNRLIKAIEDKILAATIIILISPLLLAISIGVKLSSPGPVFYRQKRVSWNGKEFKMYKFRSMPVTAEKDTGAVWATKGENRATPFGAFLRRTSLDELPQFWNVLKGNMSIVGPRPERLVFVEKFKDEIPGYMRKHMVKAGITGWAQVNGWRGDTDLKKRIEHDLYYIENWSLLFDIKIIFLTIFKGFVNKNAY
jgi:putative colanic acid biosynthesis UDP-glucose lipid carrier transferase